MAVINTRSRFGMVEGLGDEEVPWWIAPYVRDFVGLARSSAVRNAARGEPGEVRVEFALESLASRIAQTAAVARVAAHVENGKQLVAGVGSALRAEIDEYCGTPPRPHHVGQAALAVALVAAGLDEKDPAKAVLVEEASRLQQQMH